ncbi:MAG: 4Fe-4S binding protein [Dehalococcoidia bacterium]|nr:4Fe-4S binding protein [Dehalococcoidia bacterium]
MEAHEAYRAIGEKFNNQDNPHFIHLLEYLMTPDQVRVAAELPAPYEEIASKLGMDVATVNKHIDDMFLKGLVFPRDFKTREGARFARNIVQLHDATQSNIFMDHKANKELYDRWEAFSREGGGDRQYALTYVQRWEETVGKQRRSRVVPAYQSIKNNPDMIPADDIREVLKNASLIAVVACSCRKRADAVGRSCEKSHEGNCFQFGRGAEYQLVKGTGRQITYDEAIKVLEETEEDGLVHSWGNSTNMNGSVMCSCCHDCCVDWDRLTRNDIPISYRWEKSRYLAQIDDELCNGCQNCFDRCQFDAIEMVKPVGSRIYKAVMDDDKCFGCGVCVLDCAPNAIALKAVRPPEFIPVG